MLTIGELQLSSRLLLGTALYPTPAMMKDAIDSSGTCMVTASVRRESGGCRGGEDFWSLIRDIGIYVLPNTAGCHTVKEAVTTAKMTREIFETNLIKLEVIGDDYTLQPDPLGLVEAAQVLIDDGFQVLPYSTDDLVLARHLIDVGCQVVMPWASPIGSGRGILNPFALRTLRERFPEITLIVDAGIGKPSDAVQAMEMGMDGVLLNSAVALAGHPARMAKAFRQAIKAGRTAYEAGTMSPRNLASPSTPILGTPFWHQENPH